MNEGMLVGFWTGVARFMCPERKYFNFGKTIKERKVKAIRHLPNMLNVEVLGFVTVWHCCAYKRSTANCIEESSCCSYILLILIYRWRVK